MTFPQFFNAAANDPNLLAALAALFLLLASMAGGIGRAIIMGLVAFRLARLLIVLGIGAAGAGWFL